MREVVVDTETTGIDPAAGHRIVEVGCIELNNHLPTGRSFHSYFDPERDMPADAYAVHGLSSEFLAGKPTFASVADQFLDFIVDAVLVIHNAPFDIGFLNAELERAGRRGLSDFRVKDTLEMARNRHPGAQNSLDALCRRFGIDNSGRSEAHGALIDSELLAAVYLELIGGRQPDLIPVAEAGNSDIDDSGPDDAVREVRERPTSLPGRLTEAELAAHREFVAKLGRDSIWKAVYGYPD